VSERERERRGVQKSEWLGWDYSGRGKPVKLSGISDSLEL